MESLQLLLRLEGQLLSGGLADLLTPKQARLLLEGKERGTTLVLMDELLVNDLVTWMFSLRRRALGLQAMLL